MKRLIISALTVICTVISVTGQVIIVIKPPIGRVVEESMSMTSTLSSTKVKKSSLQTSSSTVYYPVSAYVDDVALTVTFTQSVGTANVIVYDANDQLVDMATIDTNSTYEAVLSTETWASGSYKLVVTYETTYLTGEFNF